MSFVVVQHGNWPGWPADFDMELESQTAAAILTAARDYQAESHRDLKGDLLALPAGGRRLPEWVTEMQWGFDHRHDTGANKVKSLAIYTKYNMDPRSDARPSMGTHPYGFCADIADNGFRTWLKAGNAKRYGLVFTLSPPLSKLNDLDHCQFFPGTATAALDVTSLDNATPTRKKKPVPFNIVKQSTLDSAGGNVSGKSLYATLGEATGPIQYTRTAANDPAPTFNTLYGPHTPLSDATWDFFIAAYTAKASVSGGSNSDVVDAIRALTPLLQGVIDAVKAPETITHAAAA